MIGIWIEDNWHYQSDFKYFSYILVLIVITLFVLLLSISFISRFSANAGLRCYEDLIKLIMIKKLGFFDETPIGRVLTLVSKD